MCSCCSKSLKKISLYFFLTAFIITALDFVTKEIIRRSLSFGQEIPVLPFFSIIHINNTGVAFGLFQGKNLLFLCSGLLMSLLLIFYAWTERHRGILPLVMFGLILGGAWGNLIDRLRLGAVTDFLDFFIGNAHWPAFNVADSAICVGAITLLISSLITKEG